MDEANKPVQAAEATDDGGAKQLREGMIMLVCSILLAIAVVVPAALLMPATNKEHAPDPLLFIRLVEAEGLDPRAPEARSPVFRLAVDVHGVPERTRGPCAGGGDDAMLRVSYHGVILAWGGVPEFCVDGERMHGPNATAASVVATAEGSVLREELRNMIHAETQALRSAEFDVQGELPGLGHLRCKTYLLSRPRNCLNAGFIRHSRFVLLVIQLFFLTHVRNNTCT
ncbi:hypothetical protein ACP70R_009954 [Stipagrostis hirtigluma subsp. patula]